jgi:RimJ/RimL family protein N-acetyltransferase
METALTLRTFQRADLAIVAPWFDDPATQRYLCGPQWPDRPIITESIPTAAGSLAFVVDPRLRRGGLGRAMLSALMGRPELRFVKLFEAGVDPSITASRRCLEAAGFHLRSPEPDVEGMLYYRAQGGCSRWPGR